MKKRILIVDDDASLREAVKAVLSGSFEVGEAGSREEGMSRALSFRPDLVILDVMMETQSAGFEMARELKAGEKTRHIKILMLSNIDKETKLDFKAVARDPDWLPADDFLDKPVDPGKLLSKVRELI